jgi:hypothetical protein
MLPSTKSGVPRELSDSVGLSGQYLVDEPFLLFTQVLLACFFGGGLSRLLPLHISQAFLLSNGTHFYEGSQHKASRQERALRGIAALEPG